MTDVEQTLEHMKRMEEARCEAGRLRAEQLRSRLPDAVTRLRQRGARRVVLFGSLAGSRPGPESDVDLAVEGLPSSEYFSALADVMETVGTNVDLVRVEDAPPSLRERIEAEGETL